MNHFNKYFITLFTASSILFSCEEDEKVANQIIIDEEKIALGNGYIVNYGYDITNNDEPISEYEIILTESDLTYDHCEIEGEGTILSLEIASPTTYKLEKGTYEFIFDESEVANGVEGSVYLNYNPETGYEEYFYIVSGKMSISKSGKTFKIKLSDLVLIRSSDGAEVEGKGTWEAELTDNIFDCG